VKTLFYFLTKNSPKTKGVFLQKLRVSKMKWNKRNAFLRVLDARQGSLDPNFITKEYLKELRFQLYDWIQKIEEEYVKYQI
jgi:hypothetical protein